jgi:hypothetical protein
VLIAQPPRTARDLPPDGIARDVSHGASAPAARGLRATRAASRPTVLSRRLSRPAANRVSSPSIAAKLRFKRELLTPALDGFRHLAESAPLVGKLVRHAHGRTVRYVPTNETALFEVLQASRQHLVSRPLGALTELAEAERTSQEDVQDERVPRAAQHVDSELKGLAPRIDRLGHGSPALTTQRIAA